MISGQGTDVPVPCVSWHCPSEHAASRSVWRLPVLLAPVQDEQLGVRDPLAMESRIYKPERALGFQIVVVPPLQVVHGLLQGAAAELLEVASSCHWVTSSRAVTAGSLLLGFFLGHRGRAAIPDVPGGSIQTCQGVVVGR